MLVKYFPATEAVILRSGEYARHVLSELARSHLPTKASDLTYDQIAALLDAFRSAISVDSESGAFATDRKTFSYFISLTYYLLGEADDSVADRHRAWLLDVCDIADARPLPQLAWTEFIRQSLSDDARIRSVMCACIYNQTQANERLTVSIKQLLPEITSSPNPSILTVGFSDAIDDAMSAIASLCMPSKYIALDGHSVAKGQTIGSEFTYLDSSDLLSVPAGYHFDIILMPCAVLSRTGREGIQIVDWAQSIRLARAMRARGAPLILVGEAQQIWPIQFYRRWGAYAAELRKQEFDTSDAILDAKDIDWLILDHYVLKGDPPWSASVSALLDSSSLDVIAALVLCERLPSLNEASNAQLREIDRKLHLLRGVPFYEQVQQLDRFEFGAHAINREWYPTMLREAVPRFSSEKGRVSAPVEEQDMRRSFKAPIVPDKPESEPQENIPPRARPENIDWEKLRRASAEREKYVLEELADLYKRAGFRRE